MVINVIQLGRVPYALGLKLQAELVSARKARQITDTLVFLEHEPVITLGRNARVEHVIGRSEQLAARGVELFECDRGGDVTFHGPGQLVGYPIFDLFGYSPRIGAVDFVRRIEEALIRACGSFGLNAGRVQGLTGVWVLDSLQSHAPPGQEDKRQKAKGKTAPSEDPGRPTADGRRPGADDRWPMTDDLPRKIAAIGVHISRGVTSHGFAFNVNTDLDYFRLIVPCGISDKPVTSMQRELGGAQDINTVAEAVARSFGQVFNSQILWVRNLDELLGRKVGVPVQAGDLQGENRLYNV